MDFVISLLIFKDQNKNSYNLILVITNSLTKTFYYKQLQTTIDMFK